MTIKEIKYKQVNYLEKPKKSTQKVENKTKKWKNLLELV